MDIGRNFLHIQLEPSVILYLRRSKPVFFRIMYKPAEGHNIVRVIESPIVEKDEVEKDKEEDEAQPRRSSRAAKRKHNEDNAAEELDEQPKTKRQRIAKK